MPSRRAHPFLGKIPAPVRRLGEFLSEKGRTDLLEITYAYDALGGGNFLNRTVFSDYGGVSFGPRPTRAQLRAAVETVRAKLDEDVAAVRALVAECRALGLDPRAKIAVGAARAAVRLLRFTREGLVFEAEKAGLPTGLSARQVEEAVVRLEKLEAPLYGGTVRSKPAEARAALGSLAQELAGVGGRATPALRAVVRRAARKMARAAGLPGVFPVPVSKIPAEAPAPGPDLSWKVPREKYVEAFREAIRFYGLDVQVKVDGGFRFVYDGNGTLYVPASREFATRPAINALGLIAHEIEAHYVVRHNGARVCGGLRGAGYLAREEGLALYLELLLKERPIGPALSLDWFQLAAEALPGDDFRTLMAASARMAGDAGEWTEPRFLRIKRGYPVRGVGCQHKDCSYVRGLAGVLLGAKSQGSVADLFCGNFSFRDAVGLSKLRGGPAVFPVLPAFLAEAAKSVLAEGNFSMPDFERLVRSRYAAVISGYGARRPWRDPGFAAAALRIARLLART